LEEILIADDDRVIRESFRSLFESEGYAVRVARGGEDALRKFAEKKPDLVLLDVMMPDRNGISVCAEIRKADPLAPVVFFTAAPNEVSLVRALGAGGDDYVGKSCPREEILARVRAALRRSAATAKARPQDSQSVRIGGVAANLDSMSLELPDGERTDLTRTECAILRELAKHRGEYVTTDSLFDALYGRGYIGDPARLRNPICRLRKKLGSAGAAIVNNSNGAYKLSD
jgi:two-component system response regulator VicR